MRGRTGVRGKSRKPNQHKNVSETFEMKEAVLAFYATHPMAAVVNEFWPGIEKPSKAYTTKVRVVRRWKQQRAHIRTMANKTTTAQRRRSREQGAAKTLSNDVEQDILEWLVALRSHGVPVSAKMLELEALEVAAMYDYSRTAFAASPSWIAAFLRRHSLSLRTKTRQGQSTPEDSDRVAKEFAATVRQRIFDEGVTTVYNADQTAVFFEYVPKHTIDERGATTVWVKCGGKSKERLTAMLLADSTGRKYDPWVVLKMRPSSDPETRVENARLRNGFSRRLRPSIEAIERDTNTRIYTNAKGWWNSGLSLAFLEHHFGDRDVKDEPVMLIWDDFSAHWTTEVIEFAAEKKVILQRVPPGYTHCCQPGDISWNKPLKDRMRTEWMDYLQAECSKILAPQEGEEPKLRAPDRKKVLGWLHAAWGGLSKKTIKGGFKRIDLLFDERVDTLCPSESDEAESGLVDTLVTLELIDRDVGEVSWDDDVVDRYICDEEDERNIDGSIL